MHNQYICVICENTSAQDHLKKGTQKPQGAQGQRTETHSFA